MSQVGWWVLGSVLLLLALITLYGFIKGSINLGRGYSFHFGSKMDAGGYVGRGLFLQETGQLDEAIASFRTAIEFQPDFADAYNELSLALREVGEEEEAQRHLDEAHRLGYESSG